MYEREIHKWTDEGKPISPAFGQNYGSIKCSLKEKTNNLVASRPQDIVILNRQHHNKFCHLSVICVEVQRTRIKHTCQISGIPWCSQFIEIRIIFIGCWMPLIVHTVRKQVCEVWDKACQRPAQVQGTTNSFFKSENSGFVEWRGSHSFRLTTVVCGDLTQCSHQARNPQRK